MTKKEVYEFIKEYDLFVMENTEEWFEDAVLETTEDEDKRLRQLESALNSFETFDSIVESEVMRWRGRYRNKAEGFLGRARQVEREGQEILLDLMEEVITVDRGDDYDEIGRDEYLADSMYDFMKEED